MRKPYQQPCNARLRSTAEVHRCQRIPAEGSKHCWQHGGRRKREPAPALCGWCGKPSPAGHVYCCRDCERLFLSRHCRPCLQDLREWPE